MLTTHRSARILPVAAFLIAALGACSDNSPPTAPLTLHPSLTQLAASPVVNSLNDPGTGTCDDTECTLREAIDFASGGATITFAPGLTGTITLTSGDLYVNKSLNLSGPGPTQLTISGGDATVLFWLTAGNTTISGLTLTHSYPSLGSGGGAIIVSNAATSLTLTNCAMTNNNGGVYGGAIRVSDGNLTVTSCTLSGNTANSGAGIIVFAGSTRIINSTISGNTGYSAVHAAGGAITIDHSTIVENSQTGVASANSSPAVTVKGSIIWGNGLYDVNGSEDNAFVSLGYNLIGTDDDGWVNFGHDFTATGDQTGVADAKLGALALNSPGATQTRALLSGSPAIDLGVCTDAAGATLATDQRGVSRPQGSACDKGAFELQSGGLLDPGFTFDVSALGTVTYGNVPFAMNGFAHTNSSGYISFALGSGSVGCSVTSGGTLTITAAAIDPNHCIIESSVAPDATYSGAGPISQSFNIAKATGSVTISNIPSSGSVGGSFTPGYTKSGDGTASTLSNSTGVCTVTSGVVDFIAVGTCQLQASVTEGTNYLAATGIEQTFSISLAAPTFAFDLSALSAKTFGDGDFSVASYATTNSTGAITFALGAGSVGCSVTSAGMVSITGAAVNPSACILEASLAADATYSSAGPLQESFNIAKAPGSVGISNLPAGGSVGGSFTPEYTKSGDGTASTLSNSTSVCTVTSGVVNYIAAGTCLLQASVTEGTNYLADTGSDQGFDVSLVTPTFAFDLSALSEKTYGDGNFSVASHAATNSTGPVTFALGTGSVGCSVTSAGMVTVTGVALDPIHCVLAATLAAHGSYAGAGPIEESFNIMKAPGSVSINNMPASATAGGDFTPAFTKSGDGSASVASLTTGVCTVTAGVVDFIAAGTCTLQASVAEGTNHLEATGSEQSFLISAAPLLSSTCTYTINAKNNQRQVTVSWANADPGVTQIQITDGRVVTKQLAPTVSGAWSTNVKTGEPTYGLWGGTARRDASTELVPAGTACSLIP